MDKNCWIFRVIANGNLHLQKHHLSYKKIWNKVFMGILILILLIAVSLVILGIGDAIWICINYPNTPIKYVPTPRLTVSLLATFLTYGIGGILAFMLGIAIIIKTGLQVSKIAHWISRNYQYSLLYEKRRHQVR